jgi:hypothetical protein
VKDIWLYGLLIFKDLYLQARLGLCTVILHYSWLRDSNHRACYAPNSYREILESTWVVNDQYYHGRSYQISVPRFSKVKHAHFQDSAHNCTHHGINANLAPLPRPPRAPPRWFPLP